MKKEDAFETSKFCYTSSIVIMSLLILWLAHFIVNSFADNIIMFQGATMLNWFYFHLSCSLLSFSVFFVIPYIGATMLTNPPTFLLL